jgi:hypothetical protein
MQTFFLIHSLTRYLVLAAGLALIAYCAVGLTSKAPPGRPLRALGASFSGLLDLQILVGLLVVVARGWYPALAGHLAMMVLAAAAAHAGVIVNRKRTLPGFAIPLAGAVVSLLLVVGGIMAIGRSPITTTAF